LAGGGVTNLPNAFGYPAPIWRRFREPAHAGVLEGARCARASTPASRSLIELALKIDGEGRVEEARFQAYGCPTTIAVGEWLAEQAQGRTVEDLRSIDANDIRAALEIPEDRAHCAILGEDLLVQLLKPAAKT
jgi:NifU-like protein involved in Fe-S cluster formation